MTSTIPSFHPGWQVHRWPDWASGSSLGAAAGLQRGRALLQGVSEGPYTEAHCTAAAEPPWDPGRWEMVLGWCRAWGGGRAVGVLCIIFLQLITSHLLQQLLQKQNIIINWCNFQTAYNWEIATMLSVVHITPPPPHTHTQRASMRSTLTLTMKKNTWTRSMNLTNNRHSNPTPMRSPSTLLNPLFSISPRNRPSRESVPMALWTVGWERAAVVLAAAVAGP